MFRWLRWQFAKRRLAASMWRDELPHVWTTKELNKRKLEELAPTIGPYERLSCLWDDFAAGFVPDYPSFLGAMETYFDFPIDSILDLACGTGLLTRQLTTHTENVTGLDVNAAMLHVAKLRSPDGHARFIEADFRDFSLNATFDACVCASDSLNYLDKPSDLEDVFRCVRSHLAPGGIFMFDVLDHSAYQSMAYSVTVACVGGTFFDLYHFYDPRDRKCEGRVVFHDAIERHCQIPVEEQHVRRAAELTGFSIADHMGAWRQFYVLRSP